MKSTYELGREVAITSCGWTCNSSNCFAKSSIKAYNWKWVKWTADADWEAGIIYADKEEKFGFKTLSNDTGPGEEVMS